MSPDIVDLTQWIGSVAATLTTCAFVPQALLIVRTRNVAGISLGMYWTFTIGVALWLVYGIRLGAWPLILANSITLVLASTILATKIMVERRQDRERRLRQAGRQPLDLHPGSIGSTRVNSD